MRNIGRWQQITTWKRKYRGRWRNHVVHNNVKERKRLSTLKKVSLTLSRLGASRNGIFTPAWISRPTVKNIIFRIYDVRIYDLSCHTDGAHISLYLLLFINMAPSRRETGLCSLYDDSDRNVIWNQDFQKTCCADATTNNRTEQGNSWFWCPQGFLVSPMTSK